MPRQESTPQAAPPKPADAAAAAAKDDGGQAPWARRLKQLVVENFQTRPLIAWLVVLTVVLVLWLRVAAPLARYFQEMEKEAVSLTATAKSLERLAAREKAKVIRAEKDMRLTQAQAERASALPAGKAGGQLEGIVLTRAKKAGLNVQNTRVLTPKGSGAFSRVRVRLQADGQFGRIKSFLNSFGKGPAYVARYTITRPPEADSGKLLLDCDLAQIVRRKK